MIYRNELLKEEAAELGRYSIHLAIVLALMFSLAVVVIISKRTFTNLLWAEAAAFAIPMPIALYFKRRIVLVGTFSYVTALMSLLGAAVLLGV